MDITLGAEEELQVVDATTGELVAHAKGLDGHESRDGGTMTSEIHQCVIETQTVVCPNADTLIESLAGLRLRAGRQAQLQQQMLVASGVHPFSRWQDQLLYECPQTYPHYAHLLNEYQDIARGALSFGLHVHLGLGPSPHKMYVMNGLREVLPEVLALSASAPFFEGRHTGLCTWRHSLLGRYPRMGIPEVWHQESDYWAHLDALRRTRCVEMHHGMWEDMRLHHVYGTIEVRIADSTPCLTRVKLLTCLLQAQAWMLHWEAGHGNPRSFWSKAQIEENKWRVRRYGLQAKVIDWHQHTEHTMQDRLRQWVEDLHPALAYLGHDSWVKQTLPWVLQHGSYAEELLNAHSPTAPDFSLHRVVQSMAWRTHQEALLYAMDAHAQEYVA